MSVIITDRRDSMPMGVLTIEYKLDGQRWLRLADIIDRFGPIAVTAVQTYDGSRLVDKTIEQIVAQGGNLDTFFPSFFPLTSL